MSGPSLFGTPRRWRRGATLTLVFSTMLAGGAAVGSLAETGAQARRTQGARIEAAPTGEEYADHGAPAHTSAPPTAPDTSTPTHPGGGPTTTGPGRIAKDISQGKAGPAAVRRMVSRSGDRWSSFYTAREYAGFQQALDGRYVGVGLSVRRIDDGRIQVAEVQKGSPAARAELRAGDVLATIDSVRCTGLPVTEVVADLRGDNVPGSPVTLGVRRGRRAWAVHLHRADLATDAVTVTRHSGGPTDIKIDAFTKGVGWQVRQAVRGADRGVLLDLRGNSGGLVDEAVATASVFLDGGLVATYDVNGRQQALYARGGGDTRVPLVVLVDGGTMSAAEMLSGALQDRGRAVVIGSRTFGKGSVQMPSPLADGSVAELTVGHYRLPDGRTVDGRGITPDVQVPAGQDPVADSREVFAGLAAPS